MTLTVREFESDCVMCASVVCEGTVDAKTFAELEQALEAIRSHIDSGEATYVAIEAHLAESAPSPIFQDRVPDCSVDQFVPFARFTTEFWDHCLVDPVLYRSLHEFIAKMEDFASYATRDDGGIWYLCEADEVLFGQPILCYLAMRTIDFVPHYARMLSYWRTEEAAAWCAIDVLSIAQQHGECSQTDALIRAYFANGGSHLDPEDYLHLLEGVDWAQ